MRFATVRLLIPDVSRSISGVGARFAGERSGGEGSGAQKYSYSPILGGFTVGLGQLSFQLTFSDARSLSETIAVSWVPVPAGCEAV